MRRYAWLVVLILLVVALPAMAAHGRRAARRAAAHGYFVGLPVVGLSATSSTYGAPMATGCYSESYAAPMSTGCYSASYAAPMATGCYSAQSAPMSTGCYSMQSAPTMMAPPTAVGSPQSSATYAPTLIQTRYILVP